MFLPIPTRCWGIALLIAQCVSAPAWGAEKLDLSKLPPAATHPVDFAKDIQPIMESRCQKCHGPEKQKGGWRVDRKDVAMTGGDEHAPNIVPGKSAESPLIHFVAGLDPDMKMPAKGDPLTAEQIGLLRAWIDQGAVWPESAGAAKRDPLDWWSLKPIVRPPVPLGSVKFLVPGSQSTVPSPQYSVPGAPSSATGDAHARDELRTEHWELSTNPIDAFIVQRLKKEGLTLSPEADARTLCRRLYFDLTGLPPTPEEIEAFAADADPQAYERLVDKLLASPRYGERWARHWLDVVHYGDTHGYDKDKMRPNAWPYRDYVIRAFNADKPYARFVEEQIAGDVIYPNSRDGLEALGFIAAGPWDLIGHSEVPETKIDGKIARHLDRDDMVANTIGTFCSATVHCAQCHNHKFDPITQEDYYSLQAVFAALDRTDRKYYHDDANNARFQELQRQQREAESTLTELEKPLKAKAGEEFAALTRKIEGASKAAAVKLGNTSPDYGYHSAIAQMQDTVKWVQVDLGKHLVIDHVRLLPCYDDFNAIGAGFGFPVRFKVETSDDPEFRTGVTLLWRRHDETFMNDFKNPGLQPFTTGGSKDDDGIAGRYVRVTATKLAPRKSDFIFALAEVQVFDAAENNVALGKEVTALDSIEAPPRWRKTNLTDGIAPVAQSPDEKKKLIEEREALLLSFADEATKAKRAALQKQRAEVEGELKKLPKPDVVYAGGIQNGTGNFRGTGPDGGKPRPIFVLSRGQVTQPGKEAVAGALSVLTFEPGRFDLAPSAPEGERRAALAHWITDEKNPLTWRSIVNRVWQYHFGHGLVGTPNDFGRNGALPTHPELLDWLAAEFRDSGGLLKQLHRLIVTSATYRQSSQFSVLSSQSASAASQKTEHWALSTEHSPVDPRTVDADNTLLWRQNRRKLEAEAVRDSVLAVSGKLDLKMGGPGWQDFVVEHPEHSPHYQYDLADPEETKTWRRSIYRFIVRSQTQPWMTSLDCADPSIRVDRRNESLSALQALALLNNGFMVTQARHFAERVQGEASDIAGQVDRAYRLALGHAPGVADRERLVAFAQSNGLPNLCRVLLNLNEFIFVD